MNTIEFKVKATDLSTAVKRVKHCMGGNEARRNLMGVNLSVSENKLNRLDVMAADGFRIARQSIEITTDAPFNITVNHYPINDRDIEKYLKPYEKTDKIVLCEIQGKYLHLNIPELNILNVKLKEEEYPILDRLLQNSESSANRIILNDVNSFYRAAEYIYYASGLSGQAVIKLSLSKPRKDGYNEQKTVSLAMGLNLDNMYFKEALFNVEAKDSNTQTYISLNVCFLKEALKVFKTMKAENLILSYADRERPCFLVAGDQSDRLSPDYTFQQVILPVKLKY